MSDENLKESLSALMDDSADELELRRVLANADDDLKATWSAYQITRSVLRKEPVFPKLDIMSAVSKVIAEEEEEEIELDVVKVAATSVTKNKQNIWFMVSKYAVAASLVLGMSFVFYQGYRDEDASVTGTDAYAQLNSKNGIDLAISNEQWIEKRLSNFVARHDKQQYMFAFDTYE